MDKNTKLVIFDDDPTGIQTVHGCLLVTDWSAENIERALTDSQPFFYILTNTRALTPADAEKTLRSLADDTRNIYGGGEQEAWIPAYMYLT